VAPSKAEKGAIVFKAAQALVFIAGIVNLLFIFFTGKVITKSQCFIYKVYFLLSQLF
jgi:hypothetical protein